MPLTEFNNYMTKFRMYKHRKMNFLKLPLFSRQNKHTHEEKLFIISKLNDHNYYRPVKQIQEQFEHTFGHKLFNKQNIYKNYFNINLRLKNAINQLQVEIVVSNDQKQVQQLVA